MTTEKKKKQEDSPIKPLYLMLFVAFVVALPSLPAIVTFLTYNPSTKERIETYYSMTLPENVRDEHHWNYIWNEQVTAIKFTIDGSDLETALNSVEWESNQCLTFDRIAGYRPDFYQYPDLEWWNPYDAENYEGVSCYKGQYNNLYVDIHMMIAWQPNGDATVYIEDYVPIDGKHPYK